MRKSSPSGVVSRLVTAAAAIAAVFASVLVAAPAFAVGTAYFVDSGAGNDSNSGTSSAAPWRSLSKVNATTFSPGDTVSFKAGGSWHGSLTIGSSGSATNPVTFGAYGSGAAPLIAGDGVNGNAVYVHNAHDVVVQGFEVTNTAGSLTTAGNLSVGIRIEAANMGAVSGITVRNNYVHNIDGNGGDYGGWGGIIADIRGGGNPTWFSNLLITGNEVGWTNDWGIITFSAWASRNGQSNSYGGATGIPDSEVGPWTPSTNLVISNNYVHDVTGGGITAIVATSPRIEGNTVMRAATHKLNNGGNGGIWWQATDDALVQKNVIGQTGWLGGSLDGQALDADIDSHNSIVQYNYTFDNGAGFFMAMPGSVGTIIRYNVSRGDTAQLIEFQSASDTRIYNNTFHITNRKQSDAIDGTTVQVAQLLAAGKGSAWGADLQNEADNNIFYSQADTTTGPADVTSQGISLKGNLYYSTAGGTLSVPGTETSPVIADPLFAAVPSASPSVTGLIPWSTVLTWMNGYTPGASSPALNAGANQYDVPSIDVLGTTIPQGAPDIGAITQAVAAPTVTISSALGTSIGSGSGLVDGSLATGWASSNSPTFPGDITLTFAKPRHLDALTIASAYGQGQAPTNVTVATQSGGVWTTQSTSKPLTWRSNSAAIEYQQVAFPSSVSATAVRITVNAANLTWSHLAINELYLTAGGTAATSMGNQGNDINAINDRSLTTGWASSGGGNNPVVVEDFSPARTVSSVSLAVSYAQGQAPTSVDVQVFAGGTWVTVVNAAPLTWTTNNATPEVQVITLPAAQTTSRLRLVVRSFNNTWGHTAINEMAAV